MRVLILGLQQLTDINAGTHPVTKEDITTKMLIFKKIGFRHDSRNYFRRAALTDECVARCGLKSIKDH